jgi:hypothetical protein
MFNSSYGKHKSMLAFMRDYDFSQESIDFMDRCCRVSDGAGADRFSVWQFLQLFNQNGWYNIYQPRLPNDVGLFPKMAVALQENNVTIKLQTTVTSITMGSGKITGIITQQGSNTVSYSCSNLIFAVSPKDLGLLSALVPSPQPFGDLSTWIPKSSYNNDIAVIFHWDSDIHLKSVWGFPYSDWGVISIVLSDYMDFNDLRSKTVISTCITYLDRPNRNGITANEMSNPADLINEVFSQLCETYPNLPPPSFKLLSPTVYYQNGAWTEYDSAFFDSFDTKYLSSKSLIDNLFQVGIQNGHSPLHITTFEAAVSNALYFVNQHSESKISIKHPLEIKTILFTIIFIIILLVVLFISYKWKTNKIILEEDYES